MPDSGLHITSALTATWLPWLCLMMVVLIWLCCMMQPQYMRGLLSSGFASAAAGAGEQAPSIGSQVAQWLFNCTLPALGVFVFVVDSAFYGLQLIGWLIGLSMLIDLARAIILMLVQYTFRFGKRTGAAYVRYFSLRSVISYILFVIVLLAAFTQPLSLWFIMLGIVSFVYLIALGIQWVRLFCSSAQDIVCVLAYLITVELLPTLILFEAGRQLYLQQLA